MENEVKWSIDRAHSEIGFKVRHLMISNVKGSFEIFDANVYATGHDFTTAQIDVWIDAASISTGDSKRDEHLIGVDFFDVQNYKQITFASSTIGKANSEGVHELWGELTMLGITKNIKLDVEFGGVAKDPYGNEKAGFTVSGKLNRSEWGLVWNTAIETGGFVVSDEIKILCEVELINIGKKDLVMELADTVGKE
jgi:polyisoprenoid-binding protein YceI